MLSFHIPSLVDFKNKTDCWKNSLRREKLFIFKSIYGFSIIKFFSISLAVFSATIFFAFNNSNNHFFVNNSTTQLLCPLIIHSIFFLAFFLIFLFCSLCVCCWILLEILHFIFALKIFEELWTESLGGLFLGIFKGGIFM